MPTIEYLAEIQILETKAEVLEAKLEAEKKSYDDLESLRIENNKLSLTIEKKLTDRIEALEDYLAIEKSTGDSLSAILDRTQKKVEALEGIGQRFVFLLQRIDRGYPLDIGILCLIRRETEDFKKLMENDEK